MIWLFQGFWNVVNEHFGVYDSDFDVNVGMFETCEVKILLKYQKAINDKDKSL